MGNSYDFRQPADDNDADDSNAPIGTPKSGYAPPSDGPFECVRCEHYASINGTHGHCDHPEVIEDLGEPATVASRGCCTYFRPEESDEATEE
jgi:hypothetical protein